MAFSHLALLDKEVTKDTFMFVTYSEVHLALLQLATSSQFRQPAATNDTPGPPSGHSECLVMPPSVTSFQYYLLPNKDYRAWPETGLAGSSQL